MAAALVTRPSRWPPPSGSSAALEYFKWHPWDRKSTAPGPAKMGDFPLKHTKTRPAFLEAVAGNLSDKLKNGYYQRWLKRYRKALKAAAPADYPLQTLEMATDGRVISGFATNPALENGLALHPLLGVPILPGSSVKGLVHHFAEAQVLDSADEAASDALETTIEELHQYEAAPHRGAMEAPPIWQDLALEALEIHQAFGSLTTRRGTPDDSGERTGPVTIRELIAAWSQAPNLAAEDRSSLTKILAHTGGQVRFYDAVPHPPANGADPAVLRDVLTPHYPEFLTGRGAGAQQRSWPSDDQEPVPVEFLSLAPEVMFLFPYRIEPPFDSETPPTPPSAVQAWLTGALTQTGWGAGAKTAAGYGYFHPVDSDPNTEG